MVVSTYADLINFYGVMERSRQEKPTLVCYLDGLGYRLYQYALENGRIPFIANHFWVCEMKTVEPSITNPAMATMLTGVLPVEHGILSRKEHKPAVPTIFADEIYRNSSAIIEGDSVIVRTEVIPRLNCAVSGENIDRLIFEGTKEAIKEDKRYIFAHFHGIDDVEHDYGPYAEEVLSRLEELDGYLHILSDLWKGNILIISDHGMHEEENGGNHGTDMEEDTIVPFGIRMKPKQYEIPQKSNGKEMVIKKYQGYDVKEILKFATGFEGRYKLVIFYSEDGFAVACSYHEVELGDNVLLVTMADESHVDTRLGRKNDVYRLIIASDVTSRRWCKNIIRIEVK